MKNKKKHLILGAICAAAAVLQSIEAPVFSELQAFLPYLTFCCCSFVIGCGFKKGKRAVWAVTVLLAGLVALPIFELIFSSAFSFLAGNTVAEILLVLVRMAVFFLIFATVNIVFGGNRLRFSALSAVGAVSLTVGAVLEGINSAAISKAMNEAYEKGDMYGWLTAVTAAPIPDFLPITALYVALWCLSVGLLAFPERAALGAER